MKTDFEARPVYLNREDRIKAHFLTYFLALLHFRLLNRSLKGTYTTEQLLHTLKDIKFTDIEEQGFMPVYERQEITDDLHETCGFRTDYQFITKRKMKGIQKKVSGDKTLLYFVYADKSATPLCIYRDCGTFLTNQLSKMRLYRETAVLSNYISN